MQVEIMLKNLSNSPNVRKRIFNDTKQNSQSGENFTLQNINQFVSKIELTKFIIYINSINSDL